MPGSANVMGMNYFEDFRWGACSGWQLRILDVGTPI